MSKPVQPGFTRVYIDHTGRWYEDWSDEQLEEYRNDPIVKSLAEEIQKEIDKEILAHIKIK